MSGAFTRSVMHKTCVGIYKTYSWIFPVNVDTINTFIFSPLGEIRSKEIAIVDDGSAHDARARVLCRVSPAAKGHDTLDVGKVLEAFPLLVLVLEDDFEGCRINLGETPVNMCVVARVGLLRFQPETVAIHIPGLIIAYTLKLGGRILCTHRLEKQLRIYLDNTYRVLFYLVFTVGDAGVLKPFFFRAGTSAFGSMDTAMTRENTTESPVTAASFERTWVEVCQRLGPIGQSWCVWYKWSALGLEHVSDSTRASGGYQAEEE
jgi:hypothetical protein